MAPNPLLVAQLTDTHLFADERQALGGIPTVRSLRAVLDEVAALQVQPDLLLLTGDLTQDETDASYQRLRDLVTPLGIPTRWLPGNHDIPERMNAILESRTVSADQCFQMGGWNFVLLSSVVPQTVYGELTPDTLQWLDAQLSRHAKLPTLIALHHPPARIGSAWMDEISLVNPEAFYAVIDRYPQVKLVIFGHIHQAFEGDRHGVRYLGTPSTCIQFKPRSREMAIDEVQPGFRLLVLYPNGHYTTCVRRVAYGVEPELAIAQ